MSHAIASKAVEVWKTWEGRTVDGKFQLRHCLGWSGRSAVFLTERGTQRAAIKLIPAGPENAEAQLARWQLGADLSHPDLIRLFEFGRCQLDQREILYVVMEYADENLGQVLPQRALTPTEISDMLPPLVEALSYLHERGLVHGGVRPSNIMAVGERLKLSSDGLERDGEPRDNAIEHSVYDAPETKDGVLSPAADVWSVGVTLVAALTSPAAAWERTGLEAALPDTIPQPFRDIARRCLRRDPRERCTLAEITGQPLTVETPEPGPAAAPEPALPRPEEHTTNFGLMLPLIAGVVVLALLVGWKVTSSHRAGSAKQPVNEQPFGSTPAKPTPAPAATTATPKGIVAGAVIRRVMPEISRSAQNTIHGKVKVGVRVSVTPMGEVSQAKLQAAGPSRYFASKSLAAAREWKFTPAQKDGQPLASQWLLRFQFARTTIHVEPTQLSP
jgi:TonB family protein